jgi:hypothetical protein
LWDFIERLAQELLILRAQAEGGSWEKVRPTPDDLDHSRSEFRPSYITDIYEEMTHNFVDEPTSSEEGRRIISGNSF